MYSNILLLCGILCKADFESQYNPEEISKLNKLLNGAKNLGKGFINSLGFGSGKNDESDSMDSDNFRWNDDTKKQFLELQQQNEALLKEKSSLNQQISKLNNDYKDLDKKHKTLLNEKSSLNQQISKLNNDYKDLDKKHKTLVNGKKDSNNGDVKQMNQQIQKLQKLNETLVNEKKGLNQQNSKLNNDYEELEKKYRTLFYEKNSSNKKYDQENNLSVNQKTNIFSKKNILIFSSVFIGLIITGVIIYFVTSKRNQTTFEEYLPGEF